jgi:hypothetical protein
MGAGLVERLFIAAAAAGDDTNGLASPHGSR